MEADALRHTPFTLPAGPGANAGLNWSSWSRCESSFSLLLVPHHPGVFALAEEIAAPAGAAAASSAGDSGVPAEPGFGSVGLVSPAVARASSPAAPQAGPRRMLALFHVAEAENLARALSRLFAAESPLRSKLEEGRCYVRYAAISDAGRRRAVAAALAQWLAAASDSAAALSSAGDPPAVARASSPADSDFAGDPFGAGPTQPPSIVNSKIVNRQSKDLRPSPLPAGF